MARRFRIRDLEEKYGDLHKVIPPLADDVGQAETGRRLGVSSATISNWLKNNGYEPVTKYVRKNAEMEQAS